MYHILVDPHTHTIASGHAFSTLEENARAAAERGLEAIAMTDHYGPLFAPLGPDGLPIFTAMQNMDAFPRQLRGMRILCGVELDIVDAQGHLFGHDIEMHTRQKPVTLLESMLSTREITIASVHFFKGSHEMDRAQGTQMYCRVLETPGTHVIGHPARAGVPFDIKEVLQTAKQRRKMIEINNHSLDFGPKTVSLCREVAEQCAQMGVMITVSSDAHCAIAVGEFGAALHMLEEIGFPEELIANRSLQALEAALDKANEP